MRSTILVALVAGLIGGMIPRLLLRSESSPQTAVSNLRSESSPKTDVSNLKVKTITVDDEQGNRRATLGVNPATSAAALAFYSLGSNSPRAVLGIRPDGATELAFYDDNGSRFQLSVEPHGPTRISITGQERQGIVIGSSLQDRTAVLFNDKEGHHRLALGLNEKNEAHVTIYDRTGKLLWSAP